MQNVSIITAEYDNADKMFGITKKIRDSGLMISDFITATSSTIYDGDPTNTLYDNNYVFTTREDKINPYIMYQFIGRKMYLKSYSIKTTSIQIQAEHHPKNWVVKGSNNNETWFQIDVEHTNVFNSKNQTEIFRCKRPNAFSFIKMIQTGPNFLGYSNYLRFEQIEFFGTLFESEYDFYPFHRFVTKCRMKRSQPTSFMFLILISAAS